MNPARVLALHFTKPSNSEAKVVSSLLRYAPPDIDVTLMANAAGRGDAASFFPDLTRRNPRVTLREVDIGVPIDPQAQRPATLRALGRVTRRLRRGDVMAVARETRPDLVYSSQQDYDCQLGTWVANALGVPHAVHLHYTVGPWLGPSTLRRLKSCERVFAISEFIAEQARAHGVDPARIVVLRNTLDAQPAVPAVPREAGAPVVIGHVGRMAYGKGFADTLAAFARVREHVAAELLLVGDGPERADLEWAARALGLAEHVRFAGWHPDVRPWLGRMDVFVFPSRHEPFGLALLEACAAGLPIVAYDEGGVPEIVLHERTGLLVPPGDVAALGRALGRLCSDAEQRARYGRAARERVASEFQPEAAGRRFGQQLLQLVGRGALEAVAR